MRSVRYLSFLVIGSVLIGVLQICNGFLTEHISSQHCGNEVLAAAIQTTPGRPHLPTMTCAS